MQKNLARLTRLKNPLFIGTVLVPTLLAIIYFGLLASDVYVSESRFVVRSPDKASSSGLGFLLKSAGFSNAGDEIFAAQDFALSRDALRQLNKEGQIAHAYGSDSISLVDRFNPVGMSGSFEDLFKYYKKRVSIEFKSTSSITTLKVEAFSAKDAQKINQELLGLSEALVNRLNNRGRRDLISYAEQEVLDAKKAASSASLSLSAFRNQRGVVDPERQATVQLQMISKLQDEMILAKTQLVQLRSFTPANPQIPVLESRVQALNREISDQLNMVAGDQRSLSATAVEFQRLQLESQFAERQLAAAMTSLEDARNEARRKQAYIERIIQPNLPDSAAQPKRLQGVVSTFLLGMIAWAIASMLLAGVKEHKD